MDPTSNVWKREERAVFALRTLYETYGYSQYKMSKFEEYDLYVRNKDFLESGNIISFNDIGGRLLALKPDVTLSIVKNGRDVPDTVQRVYYNENVYRVTKGSHAFREIMQAGLECIGAVDAYCIYEVVMLAAESLSQIADDWVLDVSHLGIVSAGIEALGVSDEAGQKLLHCIGEKNLHELTSIGTEAGADEAGLQFLKELTVLSGSAAAVLPKLKELCAGTAAESACAEFAQLLDLLPDYGADRVRVDFSVINDCSYYNGVVFRGFINGIPTGILSGGQYDKLCEKMGRQSGAIGFAVYLDQLSRLEGDERPYDVDTVLLYDASAAPADINGAVKMLRAGGQSVSVQRAVPEKLRYRQLLRLNERGVEILEIHA